MADLREGGEVIPRKTASKLMRDSDIRGLSPRAWRPVTTIADPCPHVIPDLVARRFDRGALNAVRASDITNLATGQAWLYLCAVRVGCSRRVIGYAFADNLHTDLVESALRMPLTFRNHATGETAKVMSHADRGCPYTSEQLAAVAKDLDVRLSVGRTGVCWDNAQQESFLVDPEDRVLPGAPLRRPRARHHRGQHMDRERLQPPDGTARSARSAQ